MNIYQDFKFETMIWILGKHFGMSAVVTGIKFNLGQNTTN